MDKMSVKLKLQLVLLLSVVVTAISLVIVNSISLNNLSKKDIDAYKDDVTKAKAKSVKDAIKFATQIVESYHNRIDNHGREFLKEKVDMLLSTLDNMYEKKKEILSKQEMKKLLKAIVEGTRYGKSGYFWINDTDANMIMHPIKPSLNGKNLANLKDPNGVYLFKEFIHVASTGGGLSAIIGQYLVQTNLLQRYLM